jgi:hypothetical protein
MSETPSNENPDLGELGGELAATRSGQIALDLLRNAVCPNCDGSGSWASPIGEHFVSHEMAMDAGDASMEGSSMGIEWEQVQCRWCYEREKLLSEAGGKHLATPSSTKPTD